MDTDSAVKVDTVTNIADEVTILEAKLGSLNLETIPSEGQNIAKIHNEIRTSLKNIEMNIRRHNEIKFDEKTKIHDILKKPVISSSSQNDPSAASPDVDVSNVLSYLKLLSEICPPLLQSGQGVVEKSDIFWTLVLDSIASDILSYLNVQIFKRCFTMLSSSTGTHSNEGASETTPSHGTGFAFHQQLGILLKGVRILLVYLKRAIVNLPKGVKGTNAKLKQSVAEMLSTLTSLMDPLRTTYNRNDFDIGLDIRCNIGVGICYSIYYLRHPEENHVKHFFSVIFTPSHEEISVSPWSNNEKSILDLATSDMNRIALAFGILNTWLDQNHDEKLYYSIAESILNIEHGVKEAVNLGSSRVLEIWTEKLARPFIPITTLKHVSCLFSRLEFFCFMYMTVHIDAVKNCCRNIISSLSQIYDRLDEENFSATGDDSKRQTYVVSILKTILEKPAHIKWVALACVVRNTKKSLVVLDLEPTLPLQLLTTIRAFRNCANDTYVALMSYHFEDTSAMGNDKWEKNWIEPLFSYQISQNNESNWPQKRNIVSVILNSQIMRIPRLQKMILPLLKSVVKRMNNSPAPGQVLKMETMEESSNFTEASLLAAETIKMAYELKISIDPKQLNLENIRDSTSAPEDSFRGLVPRSVLNNWLWNENPQIRLAGLALLVETKKTTDIISNQDFCSLKVFFKYNLLSQSPAFRQQFLSYFKKLTRRLKDGRTFSRRKKDAESLKNYEDFIRWLWQFFTEEEGLFCGANFARRCQSLECISELTQTFPNEFELFDVTKSGNTKYFRWLTDTYENNKILALEIILKMPFEEFTDEIFCVNLFNEAITLCKSIKPPDSVTGRYLMTLLMKKSSNKQKYSPWNILEALYSELEVILKKVQSTSLIQVACETPLYGCVRCIRMIIENTDHYKLEEHSNKYRDYVAKLLKLCFTVDNLLFPVLGSAAPEGFLPGLTDSDEENKLVVRSLSAQMLLVCAWRSMKEICLLMSDMCCWFVLEGETNHPSQKNLAMIANPVTHLLTFDQVSAIGDHLLYLLKNLMHRGVFEQVFVGFKQFTTRLWKSSAPKLSHLPEIWLQEAMDQEHISGKSITRRSAGLPFIFQALLSAECDNEPFLQKWVQRLLIFDESPELVPVRIHSTNVLRGLFRDASFSSAIMPFVPHALKMAFRGLKSTDWTERNSGLMLYGAVMRRTFGHKLNLMNAPTFFRKFPQMYDFLLNELDICIQLMGKRRKEQKLLKKKMKDLEENLAVVDTLTCDFTFHLLLLLSSFTSSGRVEDTHFKLAEFIPRIRKCGESDDMEVRKLSAKALVPFLVSPEDKLELTKVVLQDIRQQQYISQNKFHGLLVQFLTIICHLPTDTASTIIYQEFLTALSEKIMIFSNAAPTLFETTMEILSTVNSFTSSSDKESHSKMWQLLQKSYEDRFGYSDYKRNFIPGLPIADKTIATCTLKILFSEKKQETVLETVYNYFTDSSLKSKPYTDQFLELFEEDASISSKFTQHLLCTGEIAAETVVIVEAVINNYLNRVTSEFLNYPGTEGELRYLYFIDKVPMQVFESLDSEMVACFLQRLNKLCDSENGKESTTLQIKAAALLLLAKVTFSSSIEICSNDKRGLCDNVLQQSSSDVDDDMRFAVATSIPNIPFANMINFSATNQAKIWSSILMLAQDDESTLRQIIGRKLVYTNGNTYCDRKFLELLVHIFVSEFLIHNPVEGLLVLVGLLIREDFEVEAKAADDEAEDRLFDKSEMNMYFEHVIMANTMRMEMEALKIFENPSLKTCLDVTLLESHRDFLSKLTNSAVENYSLNSGLSIRKVITDFVCKNNDFHERGDTEMVVSLLRGIAVSNSTGVKSFICKFLTEFLNMFDKV